MAIVSHSRRHSCRVAPLRWCRRDDARRTGARHRMVRAPNYCELSPDYCPTHRTGTELGRYMIRYSNHRHGFGLRVHIRVTRHYRPAPPGKLLRNAPWCYIRNTGVALRVTRVAKLGGSATGLSVGATDPAVGATGLSVDATELGSGPAKLGGHATELVVSTRTTAVHHLAS